MTLETALTMALAIPSAVNDTIQLIQKLMRRSRENGIIADAELNNILECAQEIRNSVHGFTHVTSDLRPWKHAHHCTNQIIHKEMKALFNYDADQIADLMDKNPKLLARELRKSSHGSDSSFTFIRSKNFSEMSIELPEFIQGMVEDKSWYEYILYCGDLLSDHLKYQNVEGFVSILYHYDQMVTSLNETADKRLLRGLDLISDRLDQVRSMLKPDGAIPQ
jgi:hypothetical protein